MAENFIRVKQINQTDLSGFVAQVVQDTGVLGNTFVTTTSNQNISGIKTFLNNLNVSGDLTVAGTIKYNEVIDITTTGNISGYTGYFQELYANNLVYNTGNQTINGTKTFNSGIVLARAQGNTPTGLEDSKGLQWLGLGGTYYDQTIYAAYDGFQKIGINFRSSFSPTNLQDTIIFRPSKIEAFRPIEVSGNVTANNLLYNTGDQNISGIKTFVTGIIAPNLVYNTGNQTISGIKTFASRPTVNNTGILFSGEAVATPIIYDYTVNNGTYYLATGYRNVNYRVTSETPAGDISLILPSGGQNIGDQIVIDYYQNNSSQEFIRVSGYLKPTFINPQLIDSDLSETLYPKNSVSYIFTNRVYAGGTKTWEKITANAPTISYLQSKGIIAPNLVYNTGNQTISGVKTFADSGIFNSGIDLNNSKLINAVPELINFTANFNITGTHNSRVILANSATTITGYIVSGNPTGFNTSVIQVGGGQIQITGSGSNVIVSSYNSQFKTAAQFAAISLLHTGNNRYIMYGNTA